jgi:hypothetical protein
MIKPQSAAGTQARAIVPCDHSRAEGRLAEALRSIGAAGHGRHSDVRLDVGPRRGAFNRIRVSARLGRLTRAGQSTVAHFQWRPEGHLANICPALDGRLVLTPVGPTTSLLTIYGHYRPPLGAIGSTSDRLVMHRIADATLKDLTERLAVAIGKQR